MDPFLILKKDKAEGRLALSITNKVNLFLGQSRYLFSCRLLIRNYYHKKVAPISKGAYALHDFIMLWGILNLAASPSQQAEKALSPFEFLNRISLLYPFPDSLLILSMGTAPRYQM